MKLRVEQMRGFMGSLAGYDEAHLILVGAPMDYTASFRPGSRLGPQRIREVSYGLEEFSLALDRDLGSKAFFDWGDIILPLGNVGGCIETIEQVIAKIAADGKLPVIMGGEHLVSLPAVRALSRNHPDMAVVHIDAHADLRDEYAGERYSHATVMRRVAEVVGGRNIFQFGIRSGTAEELLYARNNTNIWPGSLLEGLRRGLGRIKARPVYVSVDIDVVDPAFAPGTGTPEPGGCTSSEILEALYMMQGLHVVGFDLVEVSPPQDPSEITTILAAKLIREAILCFC